MGRGATIMTRIGVHRRPGPLSYRYQRYFWGYVFAAPALLIILGLQIYPMLRGLQISFQKYDVFTPGEYVGLANYRWALTHPRNLNAFRVTFQYLFLLIIPRTIFALGLALMFREIVYGAGFFELVIYSPNVITMVVAGLLFSTLFQPNSLMDAIMRPIAPNGVRWLTDPRIAIPSGAGVMVWKSTGYYMLILLAGVLGIPQEYYDAAHVDGAGAWSRLWNVTLPLLRPQMAFVLVIALINGLQTFDLFFVLTGGGPGDATRVLAMQIYRVGFGYLEMGRAAALSMVLFVLLSVFTILQLRMFRGESY
ncbi:MAG: sugar ABC transporter permease [Chloroflexi bacterium]|nr:sugar ABC transporter permease [Chloroflexota bacterium]